MNEVKEKMIRSGKYFVISIDSWRGNIYTPSEDLNYLGSGIITIYGESLKELKWLIEEQRILNMSTRLGITSPYGNKLCKFN